MMVIPSPGPGVLLPRRGEPVFLEGAVAVVGDDVALFDLSGRCLVRVPLLSPARVIRASGRGLAVAEWNGRVHRLMPSGAPHVDDLAAGRPGYTIVSDLAWRGEELWAGTWEGSVLRLDGGPPQPVLRHAAGVQVLGVGEALVAVGGLDGALGVYQDSRLVFSHPLEPALRLALTRADGVVMVGEEQGLYLLSESGGRCEVLRDRLPFPGVAGALGLPQGGLVLADPAGQIAVLDPQLVVRARLRASAGALPLGADAGGRVLVMGQRAGARTLLVEGRAVLTHPGPLAVSPDGRWLALDGDEGVRVASMEEVQGSGEFATF